MPRSNDVIDGLVNLANLCKSSGNYIMAADFYTQALNRARNLDLERYQWLQQGAHELADILLDGFLNDLDEMFTPRKKMMEIFSSLCTKDWFGQKEAHLEKEIAKTWGYSLIRLDFALISHEDSTSLMPGIGSLINFLIDQIKCGALLFIILMTRSGGNRWFTLKYIVKSFFRKMPFYGKRRLRR